MANPGLLLKGAKMLSKTPIGKKAKKKIAKTFKNLMQERKSKDVVGNMNKYKQGRKGPGASTRTTRPAEVSKSYGQQQASTNNLLKDGMTKKMEMQNATNVRLYKESYKKIVK